MLRPATAPADLEAPARAALEDRAGRPLTDEEWEGAKHDFLALFRLLHAGTDPIAPNTEPVAKRVLSLAISDGSE